MRNPYDGVAIVGTYNTVQAKQLPNWTEPGLVLDAIRGALGDAGLTADDVDGVNISSWVSRLNSRTTAQWFGARPMWTGVSSPGVEAILEAAAAIQTGQAETVVIAAAQCGEYTDSSKCALLCASPRSGNARTNRNCLSRRSRWLGRRPEARPAAHNLVDARI